MDHLILKWHFENDGVGSSISVIRKRGIDLLTHSRAIRNVHFDWLIDIMDENVTLRIDNGTFIQYYLFGSLFIFIFSFVHSLAGNSLEIESSTRFWNASDSLHFLPPSLPFCPFTQSFENRLLKAENRKYLLQQTFLAIHDFPENFMRLINFLVFISSSCAIQDAMTLNNPLSHVLQLNHESPTTVCKYRVSIANFYIQLSQLVGKVTIKLQIPFYKSFHRWSLTTNSRR